MSSQYHLWRQAQYNNSHEQCTKCGDIIFADALDSNGLCSSCIAEAIDRIEAACVPVAFTVDTAQAITIKHQTY